MKTKYCPNCKQEMGFKRSLGVGTILMIVLTAGWGLLLLPLYPSRCVRCGNKY